MKERIYITVTRESAGGQIEQAEAVLNGAHVPAFMTPECALEATLDKLRRELDERCARVKRIEGLK